MSVKKEKENEDGEEGVDWGDGHRVPLRRPNLDHIPGDSVVCPMPCHPVGEDEAEWKKHERGTRKPVRERPKRG